MRALWWGMILLAGSAQAEIRGDQFEYQDYGRHFVGYLAYDDASKDLRPGVLVIHEWWGLNDYARGRARDLAQLGYVALAVDMYGDGRSTTDAKQAGAWAAEVRGTPLMRKHAQAGLKALTAHPLVDNNHLGAIGFCFGGTSVLELAYSGAKLDGVVSFHGNLPARQAGDKPRASILVLHGAADPYVKADEKLAFIKELDQIGADWQLLEFGGAMHSFSNPASSKLGMPGVAYDKKTAARAWTAMQAFLQERFHD